MEKTLISVVMPCRNSERFLRTAVNSLLAQTYPYFELIAIEDGSTDKTGDILREYQARDSRVRLFYHEISEGVVASLNEGCGKCCGEFIARMDSDDIAAPDRFEKQLRFMTEHPEVSACGSAVALIDENDHILGHRQYPQQDVAIRQRLFYANPMAHPSVMLRKEHLKQLPYVYDSAWPCVEDYELWFRLSQCGKLCNLPEILLSYRISGQSVKSNRTRRMLWNTLKLKFKHRKGMPVCGWFRFAAELLLLFCPAPVTLFLFEMSYRNKPRIHKA